MVMRFVTWSQEDPRAVSFLARLLHHAFRIRQRLPGREGILLIFTGAIGDMVSLSPAIRGLAQQHSDAPLGMIVKGSGTGSTLKACPYVDQVVELNIYEDTPFKWWELLKVLWRIAWRHKYTTAALTMGTGWMPHHRIWALLLLHATGTGRRLAFRDECAPWWNAPDAIHRLPLANEIIDTSQPQRTDRFMDLFQKAGLLSEAGHTGTEIWTGEDEGREVARLDERFVRHDEKPVVLVFPGVGSGPGKEWPPGRYVKLVSHLIATYDAHVFLDGTSRDRRLCEIIAALVRPCRNLAGRHSTAALFVLIKLADLVIASDSGPIHIAGATGTPAVAIFGPTDPRIWAPKASCLRILRTSDCRPCGNPYACERERDFACIRDVTVFDAVQACRSILLHARPRHQ